MDPSAYLRRLGRGDLIGAPADLETLTALHSAHMERVAYETLEIWLDRPTTVDPLESAARIVGGRGGYCYHLNGAFGELLRTLGYEVRRHVGGIQPRDGEPEITGNHVVLTVHGLGDSGWLVDMGMGDGPHRPLPLVEGVYEQGPFTYGLRPSEIAPGGWRFDHDPSGSFPGMDFGPAEADMTAFIDMHEYLSTSPESGFVKHAAVVGRVDSAGVDVLRGLSLTRIGLGRRSTTLETADDYFAALADVFWLTLDDVTTQERERLWARLVRAHERWLAAT
ncbi:arylamine N-acetyltransferase [Nonomuraea sp. NPDC050556]|uniref:arylamine N-acetyltransferase n=1 Tax=Nonomuraea sp. NPDC050556 TaxID=3364369 RepID=UPI0037B47728